MANYFIAIFIVLATCYQLVMNACTLAGGCINEQVLLGIKGIKRTGTHMHLSNLRITTITPGTFVNFKNLAYLNLSSNSLTQIGLNTFKGTFRVTFLDLCNNSITTLAPNWDKDLVQVRMLYLSINRFTAIPANTFSRSRTLQYLYIGKNQITNAGFGMSALNGLTSLKTLVLECNYLQLDSLDKAVFSPVLTTLQTLSLTHNPNNMTQNFPCPDPDLLKDFKVLKYFLLLADNSGCTFNQNASNPVWVW